MLSITLSGGCSVVLAASLAFWGSDPLSSSSSTDDSSLGSPFPSSSCLLRASTISLSSSVPQILCLVKPCPLAHRVQQPRNSDDDWRVPAHVSALGVFQTPCLVHFGCIPFASDHSAWCAC
ncbi:hypothetical protein DL89DRAFT_22917 [Linderina pennispora]|uniref:Secreted protein n=1 Tax=Linderina pennispora TaxID=61395 RepID=A0A1Y1WMM2_9FUNG|nr:uncharacterized protein DL89DRAFT_22917 [Linderina pennispora]ORX74799.1 hypothetical protein DL89DRAFT_22917 [Linderina pennispora]